MFFYGMFQDALDKEHLLQACDQLMERNQHLERVIQEQKQVLTRYLLVDSVNIDGFEWN